MEPSKDSKELFLANLLLKLHHDDMTGVVTVKDNRRAVRIYLRRGHVVYADGIDKDSLLLREIAAKKGLDQRELDDLKRIKERDPQSLGKTLIERKIISGAVWTKFLELKVKSILSVAFEMENAEVGFSKTELNLLPVNFIDYNILQLLLDTLRGIEGLEHLRNRIPGDEAVLALSPEAESLKSGLPLSPSEQKVLALVDGRRTVKEILGASGLDQLVVYKNLYLLTCFGLIKVVKRKGTGRDEGTDYPEIIHLYLDLLGIIEKGYRKEVGKEFDNIFVKCRDELTGQSKELFHDLILSTENQDPTVKEILRRFASQSKAAEGRLVLLASFNKLVFLLIMRMKKILGVGLAERTLNEMMSILDYVEKYRQDTEVMNYVKGNLKDYSRQLKS
ncbi:MAG: hypothetical protein JXL84_12915 [Deltaproteobacteria bacterium]|nr:hypothetical protein [Deltaproteobacteria bacterium]